MKFTFSYLLHLTSFLRPENLKRKLTVCTVSHECHYSFDWKKYKLMPIWTLNVLWMITDLAQRKIFVPRVLQPSGSAIISPRNGQNKNLTPLRLTLGYL